MATLEGLKKELKDKEIKLRQLEIELKQRTEAFEKLRDKMSPKFEVKYDIDIYGLLYDTTDGDLGYRYAEACEKIMQVEDFTKKFLNARSKLTILVDEYVDLMEGPLPKKIERAKKEIASLKEEIKRMERSES